MKFAEIIEGLLEGKNYCYTEIDKDDVHFFVTIDSPINGDNDDELCIVYFEDMEHPYDDMDPEPFELCRADLEHDLWREVKKTDYWVGHLDEIE